MIRFLIRSWVYPFYKAYAGVLLAMFLLASGVLRGEDHLTMALFFTSHVKNLVYPLAGMVLFEWLTIHFSLRWLSEAKNRSIQEIIFMPPALKIKVLLKVVAYLQLPVVMYTALLLGVALYAGNFLTFFMVIFAQMIRIGFYVLMLNRVLLFPKEKEFKSPFYFRFAARRNIRWTTLFLRYFIHEKFLSLLLSKIFSLSLLGISVLLISTVDQYERFAATSFLLVFLSNAFLPYSLFRFQNIDLNVFRNLPSRPSVILSHVLFTVMILTLPEILFMFRNFHPILTPVTIGINVWNGIIALLFLYAMQIYITTDLRSYIFRIFWGAIFLFILLLFDFPVYLLTVVLCLFSFYFYFSGYYLFETVFDQSDK